MELNSSKAVMDALSIGTAVATIVGWLPAISAVLAIIWTAIRIYETATVQKLLFTLEERKAKSLIKEAKVEAVHIIEVAKDAAIELKQDGENH